jgi:hypothetical protein
VWEYGFELRLCAHLEAPDRLVARQLGAAVHGRRVTDVACLEPGPDFAARAAITPETIPLRAIESDAGPGRAVPVRDAFDCPPETARKTVDAAVEVGFFDRLRRDGQPAVRQTARYPDEWVGRLVGVECKPDLDRPGALQTQLLTDVELGLFDAVVLATASHVTGAHLNRLPDPVGVWTFDPETATREVIREPTRLAPEEPGVEILDRDAARTEIRIATADDLYRQRRRLAERAYGKGWRPTTLPACDRAEPDVDGVPYCPWLDRVAHAAADCGADCQGHVPAEPPAVDRAAERAANSPWKPDPPGRRETQAGLDRF